MNSGNSTPPARKEYLRALENHAASHKLNLGDGESVLSLLYEAYSQTQIRAICIWVIYSLMG